MNCEIFCSSSVKNAIGNLIRIALNLQIAFGSIVIFTKQEQKFLICTQTQKTLNSQSNSEKEEQSWREISYSLTSDYSTKLQ